MTGRLICPPASLTSRVLTLLLCAAFPAAASADARSVPAGETFTSPAHGLYAEAFTIPSELSAALAASQIGQRVRLPAFPTAPGERQQLELERVDIYAPGARVIVADSDGDRLSPRSARLHFLGASVDDPATRVGLSFEPQSGSLRGLIDSLDRKFEISQPASDDPSRHRLTSVAALIELDGGIAEPHCGTEEIPLPESLIGRVIQVSGERLAAKGAGSEPTHSAVIAVDTDGELLDEKFGNNTAAATDWIADLFVEMNTAYERDVGLRLLLGDSFLRPGTPPYTDDPWDVTGSPASGAHLNEFGSYWSANMAGVDRVFAMLLSGKSSSGNSASGIAWVDGYCEFQNTGGGYSVNLVFTSNFSSATLVAHEIGHNAGSPHTHCYTPEVDQCFNAQNGCYDGPVSCPGGGPGTIMSYCNFSPPNGAGCGQNTLDFHPTVAALFDTFIAAHSPGCVEELTASDLIFVDGFESGNLSAW